MSSSDLTKPDWCALHVADPRVRLYFSGSTRESILVKQGLGVEDDLGVAS